MIACTSPFERCILIVTYIPPRTHTQPLQIPIVSSRLLKAAPPLPSRLCAQTATSALQMLEMQRRLGHLLNVQQAVECIPEMLVYGDDPERLRTLFTACTALGFKPYHLSLIFVSLRNDREKAAGFLRLTSAELHQRYEQLHAMLSIDAVQLSSLLAFHPGMLLIEPQRLASSAAWLQDTLGWRNDNLATYVGPALPAVLSTSEQQLSAATLTVQTELDLPVDVLLILLRCVPTLLATDPADLEVLCRIHGSAYRLAGEVAGWPGHATENWEYRECKPLTVQQMNILYLLSQGMDVDGVNDLMAKRPTAFRRRMWEGASG
jgi:hypothetical protein